MYINIINTITHVLDCLLLLPLPKVFMARRAIPMIAFPQVRTIYMYIYIYILVSLREYALYT